MDVRCERCRAQYVLDDEQVTPAGVAVQCTNCGHLFKVKKKELVVTVPVKPDELEGAAVPASAAAPRAAGGAPPAPPDERDAFREWHVRQANGNIFTFRELTTLQKWIVERKVERDDEISRSGEQWKRLGNIGELATFFQVVEAADRGRAPAAVPTPPAFGLPISPQTTAHYPPPPSGYPPPPPSGHPPPPPSGYPPPSFAIPPPPGPRAAPPPPASRPEPLPGPLNVDVDLRPEELAVVRKGRGVRFAAAAALVLAAAGAVAYVVAPQLFQGMRKEPAPLLAPADIEVPKPRPPEPPPPQEATPAPTPPAPEPAAAPPPAPPPAPREAPRAPKGPKAILAQADKLREKGDAEAALDLYGRVADDDPENVEALTGRGLCYLDLEKYPPAEASFQTVLRIDPRQPDALLGLAEAYRWQGKKADAIKYYERYLAVDPQGEDAAVARNALEELRR